MTACYNITFLKPLHLNEDDRKLILDALWFVRSMTYGLNFPYSTEDVDKLISHISDEVTRH